jgi:23S rRNA pseudouridine1911/1915/1917 synthase
MTVDLNINKLCVYNSDKKRLDSYLANLFPEFSRSTISTWIKEGYVCINDIKVVKANIKVVTGDVISISAKVTIQNMSWHKQNIPLDIIFEDEHIIVLNKPPGLTVHPGSGQPDSTLANGLHYYCDKLNQLPRMGIVHRLDKDTSGIMVVAKTNLAHASLVAQLQEREVSRTYHTIVNGNIIAGGSICTDIGRSPKKRTAMAVVFNGKEAITHYRVKQKFNNYTLLEVNLETGRTHQIRVHMSYIKHPIVGDQTYGTKNIKSKTPEKLKQIILNFKRQALHAKELKFIHPFTNEEVSFSCPYPDDFKCLLETIIEEDSYE